MTSGEHEDWMSAGVLARAHKMEVFCMPRADDTFELRHKVQLWKIEIHPKGQKIAPGPHAPQIALVSPWTLLDVVRAAI